MLAKRILLGSFVVFTALFVGCSEETELQVRDPESQIEDPESPVEDPLSEMGKPKLAIVDASSLVLFGNSSNSGGRMATMSSNLYKITAAGSVEEVTFLNEDNTPIDPAKIQTMISVNRLSNVGKDYIMLQGAFVAWDTLGNTQQYAALLVKKGDGSIYDFNDADMADGPIFEDEAGNFYYKDNNGMIRQIDVSNPDVLRKKEYLPSGQIAHAFGADKKGNVFYQYGEDLFRIRKRNGGISELNIEEELPGGPIGFPYGNYKTQGMWIGANGRMYLETYDYGVRGVRPHFHTVSVDEQGIVAIDTLWTGTWTVSLGGSQVIAGSGTYLMERVKKTKSILFVKWNAAWEFFEETNTVVEVNLPRVEFFDDFFYSDTYLYYRSGLDIYKISLSDYSYVKLSLPGNDQYEIYSMNIGDSETLQLSMLRFSDGKKIIAQISSSGVFSVVDQELDKEAILLQRLN